MDSERSKTPLLRRDFLSKLLTWWGTFSILSVAAAILKYLTPPEAIAPSGDTLEEGTIYDIPINSAKIVKFHKEPVILVHTASDQFRAFNARCTHLGCIVQFVPAEVPHFACNCHGSQYDINGKNIAGPAPRPLTPMRVTIRQTTILVSKI